MMHCPGCGTEAPVTQKFCRSCGFCLEKVPQLVAEQLSESEEILTSAATEKLQRRQQKIEHWLSITGLGFTVLMALSVLVGHLSADCGSIPLVPGIVLLTLILGGSVAGLLALYSENLKKKMSGSSSLRSKQLPEEDTSKLPSEQGSSLTMKKDL